MRCWRFKHSRWLVPDRTPLQRGRNFGGIFCPHMSARRASAPLHSYLNSNIGQKTTSSYLNKSISYDLSFFFRIGRNVQSFRDLLFDGRLIFSTRYHCGTVVKPKGSIYNWRRVTQRQCDYHKTRTHVYHIFYDFTITLCYWRAKVKCCSWRMELL